MNYRLFLNSENPEVKMSAMLADLSNTDSYSVVKEVVEEIKEHTKGDFAESRYFKQMVSMYSYAAVYNHNLSRLWKQ